MVVTHLQKAEAERGAIEATLNSMESMLTLHKTTPLDEPIVDSNLEMTNNAKSQLIENLKNILQCMPQDPQDYHDKFQELLCKALRIHSGYHGIKMSFPPPASSSTAAAAAAGATTAHSTHEIRLPTLQIPVFSGDLQQWLSFRDMFQATVHKRKGLSKIEKLTLLKSLVAGEAARQIHDIILSDTNYDIAWLSLCDRYNNNRELLFTVCSKLFHQPNITNPTPVAIRQLMDTTKACIRSLQVLSIKTDDCQPLILYLLSSKLDIATREAWLQSLTDKEIPNLSELFTFLEQRAASFHTSSGLPRARVPPGPPRATTNHTQTSDRCGVSGCGEKHKLFQCDKFRKLTPQQRVDHVTKAKSCFNCLGGNHSAAMCRSTGTCRFCGKKHNSLLHIEQTRPSTDPATGASATSNLTNYKGDLSKSLLATAVVKVNTSYGPILARALLDSCSTNSFITESFVKKWRLSVEPSAVAVEGVATAQAGTTSGMTTIGITPHFRSNIQFSITTLILETISSSQPSARLDNSNWHHLDNLELADPSYNIPAHVDILLGGDLFWSIFKFGAGDKITAGATDPFAVNSKLGWLVVGPINNIETVKISTCITNVQLDKQLERFWNTEAVPEKEETKTPEETQCETIVQQGLSRLPNGRYTVPIPWKANKHELGESRYIAVQRLKLIERKLSLEKNKDHKEEYARFMREYEELGHMTKLDKSKVTNPNTQVCYIPHHFVLKLDSTTTKLRVVFDGSCRSSTGVSLNDVMMKGPVVQSSLFDICIRFRIGDIGFVADIEKMYRQIQVNECDRDMQRIVWRESESDPIADYQLNTATYGTVAASYLSTGALDHLAESNKTKFPIAHQLIKKCLYVDDLKASMPTVHDAIRAIGEISELCESAQMKFRKWASNSAAVLERIPEELRASKQLVPVEEVATIKTLGIYWNSVEDHYQFKINLDFNQQIDTKRTVLSDMSKLFDPMGWLAPVTIRAKIIMQDIWKANVGWDERIPISIQEEWNKYKETLPLLEGVYIPRAFSITTFNKKYLVGFADSSLKAYAAVVYLYGVTAAGEIKTTLLTSKTRVASINSPSLPRLELNASVLLAELMSTVHQLLDFEPDNILAYSDSTIVLGWIQSDPQRWKMYVKNRVIKIHQLLPTAIWSHVKGTENPADCASRGINADEFCTHQLWLQGNIKIFQLSSQSQHYDLSSVSNEERKQTITCAHIEVNKLQFIAKYSTLRKLSVFTCAVIRLKEYFKSGKSSMRKGFFSTEELQNAKKYLVKYVQQQTFSAELNLLQQGKGLSKGNALLSLDPFVDKQGLLRVGGRLRHARIATERKHPVLLPRSHRLTQLIVTDIHNKHFHSGPQQTLATVNQQYWIVRGRDAVRYILKQCVTCRRHKASLLTQQMGDLPEARVNAARAFLNCGVDYAGPFVVKNFGRSKIIVKIYLAVFVCLATKAIHIEMVTALSTEAFIAALRRFISRRGRPIEIFSDCGTNFVGANKELREMFAFQQQNEEIISSGAAHEGTKWRFNPPGAPHMGGMWEAGVKSIKYHLKRVIGTTNMNFEEMLTLINQIEGLLNSRPITIISTDPNDLQPLTPAHFLIGEPIMGLPEPNLVDVNIGRLGRWQLLQHKQQSFWRRWSSEFITRMQQRPKWMKKQDSIKLNTVVIIKDENQPPGKWKLGRVVDTHPGADGLVRVVTLKTTSGLIKRPIAKLCVLVDFDSQ